MGSFVGGGCRTRRAVRPRVDVGNFAGMWLDPANAPGCGLASRSSTTRRRTARRALHPAGLHGRRSSGGGERRLREPARTTTSACSTACTRSSRRDHAGAVRRPQRARRRAQHRLGLPARPRRRATPARRAAAYRGGRSRTGASWPKVPIVDIRGRTTSTNPRRLPLLRHAGAARPANGGHGNQVIWTLAGRAGPVCKHRARRLSRPSLELIDRWLAAVRTDRRRIPHAGRCCRTSRTTRSTPAGSSDAESPTRRPAARRSRTSATRASPPAGADRRRGAVPTAPLRAADYPVAFTPAQWAGLQRRSRRRLRLQPAGRRHAPVDPVARLFGHGRRAVGSAAAVAPGLMAERTVTAQLIEAHREDGDDELLALAGRPGADRGRHRHHDRAASSRSASSAAGCRWPSATSTTTSCRWTSATRRTTSTCRRSAAASGSTTPSPATGSATTST